jgi:hypothetical protein
MDIIKYCVSQNIREKNVPRSLQISSGTDSVLLKSASSLMPDSVYMEESGDFLSKLERSLAKDILVVFIVDVVDLDRSSAVFTSLTVLGISSTPLQKVRKLKMFKLYKH